MKKTTLILVAILAATLAAMMASQLGHGNNGDSRSSFVTMGQMAAEETARLVNNHGRIALLTGKGGNPGDPLKGPVMRAFRNALPYRVSIVPSTDADQPAVGLTGVSVEEFVDFINKHSDVDAIVSFVGVPSLSDAQVHALPTPRPKMACFYASVPPRSLFLNDILQLAIIPNLGNRSEDAQHQTGAAWFNTQFVVVTAKNADSLPDSSTPDTSLPPK